MPETFAYKVKDRSGRLVRGTLEADSADLVVGKLRSMGYTPIDIQQQGGARMARDVTIPGLSSRIKLKDVAVFSRQFATMINSGLSLLRTLTILADQTESKPLAEVVGQVRVDVERGSSLSAALGKHPKAFNRLYVAMVRAGEIGGVLDSVLLRLADTIESQVELRRRVRSAMTYPAVVAVLVLLIVSGMLLFVIPMFEGLYDELGGTLPLPTKILLDVSGFVRHWFFPILVLLIVSGMLLFVIPMFEGLYDELGGTLPLPTKVLLDLSGFVRHWFFPILVLQVVAVFGFRRWITTDEGRERWDSVKLRFPVFGGLVRKTALARFARTLSALVRSGVPILESLDIVAVTAGNSVVARAVRDTQAAVKQGEPLAARLEQHDVFPPMVVQMILVGEETGALDEMLDKIADFYDAEVKATVDALTSLIEPLLIVVMGVAVGGMVIALYLPMFNIIKLLK